MTQFNQDEFARRLQASVKHDTHVIYVQQFGSWMWGYLVFHGGTGDLIAHGKSADWDAPTAWQEAIAAADALATT